jgi:nitrate/nitrite transporter NarK
LLSESGLWRVLATSSLVITGVDLFQVYMPIYGHGIGLSASAIGIILAINSLASFVIRIFLPSLIKRFNRRKGASLLISYWSSRLPVGAFF